MSFYDILVFIHIFSAILCLGPGFVMIYFVTKAKTMTDLRHAYVIRNLIHVFVMVGGILLVVIVLWMAFLNMHLFTQGWYIISLILFLIALLAGPTVLAPKAKPIKALLQEH